MRPRETLAARLAARGFADADGALRVLTEELTLDVNGADADLVLALAGAADPDQALARLAALGRDQELLAALRADQGLRARLTAVLGVSAALADHLRRHREDWRLLASPDSAADAGTASAAGEVTEELLASAGGVAARNAGAASAAEELLASTASAADQDKADALRTAYRRRLLMLAARDLTGAAGLDEVMAELADLAAAALQAALAIAASRLPAAAAQTRLAVIAMGKCGARELNYASNVDVIFVADQPQAGGDETDALRAATQLASAMIRICSERGAEGAMFPVDANLRPEGRTGPLVRTIDSHLTYYQRWAKTWEFQALLKARPVAGDAELGQDYLHAVTRLVWQAAQRDDFVADVQAMRRRVIANLPASEADREIKLGPGGLRDIEFAVQLLQLVHGRADETLRDPATLPALGPWPPAVTSAGPTGLAWPTRTDSCARSNTCCSSASSAAPTRCRPIPRCCASSPGPCEARLPRQPGLDGPGRPGHRTHDRVATACDRGPPAARETVLPAAARRRGPAARRCDQAHFAGREGPA